MDNKFSLECESFLVTSRKSIRLYRQMSTEGIKAYGFKPNEVDVLAFLVNNPSLNTATDISNYRGISKALVCKAVEQLCKKGYLSCSTNEKDRRIVHLKLEDKANDIIKILEETRLTFFKILYGNLSDEEIQSLVQITQKIRKNID